MGLGVSETDVSGQGETVAVIYTDAVPADPISVQTAANELRNMGTRVFVGLVGSAGSSAWQSACSLVGAPCADNVEVLTDWSSFASAEGTGRILAALCRQIEEESTTKTKNSRRSQRKERKENRKKSEKLGEQVEEVATAN